MAKIRQNTSWNHLKSDKNERSERDLKIGETFKLENGLEKEFFDLKNPRIWYKNVTQGGADTNLTSLSWHRRWTWTRLKSSLIERQTLTATWQQRVWIFEKNTNSKLRGKLDFYGKIEGWMTIQIWKKSRGNPIIYVTIKTSKEELHNLKLSLNQPTFNNYTKTLETYCQQEEKSFIKSEINAMIKKKAIVQTMLLKKEKKKLSKWKLK